MSDAFYQPDLFKRVNRPRPQMMAYRDHGWNADGEEICEFECPKCGDSRWLAWKLGDAAEGPECPTCNRERR